MKLHTDACAPQSAGRGVSGAISFDNNSSEYDHTGIYKVKGEGVANYKLARAANAFNLRACTGDVMLIRSAPMKGEKDVGFIQKRTSRESELMMNSGSIPAIMRYAHTTISAMDFLTGTPGTVTVMSVSIRTLFLQVLG